MEGVIRAVDRIRSVPGACIDRSIRQGDEAVFAQFRMRFDQTVREMADVEDDIATIKEGLEELHTWVAPHRLPDDYVFFLEFYGGLQIKVPSHFVFVFGLGPMTLEWYDDIMGEDALCENGFLLISTFRTRKREPSRYVHFFLDLAGVVQQYCVLGMEATKPTGDTLVPILQNPHAHLDRWTKHGDSFTEWLEQLAATNGSFGYV